MNPATIHPAFQVATSPPSRPPRRLSTLLAVFALAIPVAGALALDGNVDGPPAPAPAHHIGR